MSQQLTFNHARWRKAQQRYTKAKALHRGQRRAWAKLRRWATAALRAEI